MEFFEYFRHDKCKEKEIKGNDMNCGMLLKRKDIRYINAGVMVIPNDMKEKRQYSLLLPRRLVYACHAGAFIHYLESWNYHEVGEVIIENMEMTLNAAQKHGFSIDSLPKSFLCDDDNIIDDNEDIRSKNLNESTEGVDVVIIGCGPSGLAVAGSLTLNNKTIMSNNINHSDNNEFSQNRNKNQIIEKNVLESYKEGERKIKGMNVTADAVPLTMRMIDSHENIEGQVRPPSLHSTSFE